MFNIQVGFCQYLLLLLCYILIGFLLVMALLTALVGSIGLTGTMGMNVLERTREIGVMRAIGAVDSEIVKSVIIEGTFIGLISWVFGALLSIPITFVLLDILAVAFSAPIPVSFTADGFVLWLGVVLILAASRLLPDIDALLLTTNTLGIVSLLLAPLVLLATVILTLAWPGARQQMRDCNH